MLGFLIIINVYICIIKNDICPFHLYIILLIWLNIYRWKEQFAAEAGSFLDFTRSYKKYGLNVNKNGDLEYREWAPAAREVSIVRYILLIINIFTLVWWFQWLEQRFTQVNKRWIWALVYSFTKEGRRYPAYCPWV